MNAENEGEERMPYIQVDNTHRHALRPVAAARVTIGDTILQVSLVRTLAVGSRNPTLRKFSRSLDIS